ncbi:galactose-3-O-sulfotransferase 4-like [Neocloeon triangulifer]|uniref:galactose-3-O-sulfotransferase 4-like n=1 Tax=Neocloeon triangulifer TaxID=2078957 RepID=UPI00286F30F8|nr:galactose-3-O-sulfotransferase 4-like [Neocloeon triangulifer]
MNTKARLTFLLIFATILGYGVINIFQRNEIITDIYHEQLFGTKCIPKEHIFFLKVHKCGSSTVQNILMRRGYLREKNFVLPKEGHYLGHPEPFSKSCVDARFLRPTEHFDIFTHHSRFGPAGVTEVMPSDVKKVAIVREPAKLFESLYNYYKLNRGGYATSLKALLQYDLQQLKSMAKYHQRWGGRIGFNQMAFDAGLAANKFDSKDEVDTLIGMMDTEFDLVMVSEHMEVSLVLLAELMCWPLEQVAFIKLNARPSNSGARTVLTDEEKEKLRQANGADARIYEHFKRKFRKRVDEYGRANMARKVAELKGLNEKLTALCIDKVIPPEDASKDYPVFTYQINDGAPDICKLVVMEELKFTDLLKQRQLERFSHFDDFDYFMNAAAAD